MGAISRKTPFTREIAGEYQSSLGYFRRQKWTDAIAPTSDEIVDGANIDGSLLTADDLDAQPDFPRNLTIVASGTATGNVVVTGTNIRNEVITETIALNGNTPVLGNKAFKRITSIQLPTVADRTIDIGVGAKLGLDRCMAGNEILYATVDGVREGTLPTMAVSATVVESNTAIFNTAPNGSRDLVLGFISTERTSKVGTTA